MRLGTGLVIQVLINISYCQFNSKINVENQDLIKSSRECFNDCLGRGNTFCRDEGEIGQGFCCDREDCSKFDDEDLGYCSNEATQAALRVHSCPFEQKKCKSRSIPDAQQIDNEIYLSTNGKYLTLQPNFITKDEICHHVVAGGVPDEKSRPRPTNDEYLTIRVLMSIDVDIEITIAESLTSEYVDVCRITQGDYLFARYPYKMFASIQSLGNAGNYFIEMQYLKSISLPETDNRNNGKCYRVQNQEKVKRDDLKGSTVGGKYGFGKASNPKNDDKDGAKESKDYRGQDSKNNNKNSGGNNDKKPIINKNSYKDRKLKFESKNTQNLFVPGRVVLPSRMSKIKGVSLLNFYVMPLIFGSIVLCMTISAQSGKIKNLQAMRQSAERIIRNPSIIDVNNGGLQSSSSSEEDEWETALQGQQQDPNMRRQRARVEALNAEIARQRQDSSSNRIRPSSSRASDSNSRDDLDDVLAEADRIVGPEYHQQQERNQRQGAAQQQRNNQRRRQQQRDHDSDSLSFSD